MSLIDANCVILSAGEGKRMGLDGPKVLCEVLFKPMINWVLDSLLQLHIKKQNTAIVVGFKKQMLIDSINDKEYTFCEQEEINGTAGALKTTVEFLKKRKDKPTLVLCGDAPFMDKITLESAYNSHVENNASLTVITCDMKNPFGYGRIIRSKDNQFLAIIEEKDLCDEQKNIFEVNSGAYIFDTEKLIENIFKIKNNNLQGEYYLTDIISIFKKESLFCNTYKSKNEYICYGANTKTQLFELNNFMKRKINLSHLDNGVEFIDIDNVYISPDSKIESGTKILPLTILKGKTKIGKNCVIGPNTVIENSEILDYTKINASQVYNSFVGESVKIGPFSHIRPNTNISNHVKIGDFVEVKNSKLGQKTSVAHLSYIGDSEIGARVNVGCGVVTVNYDGVHKNKTLVDDDCFIGCNVNLISPVHIKRNSYIAAGSTITDDVEENSLAIARSKQTNILDWVLKKFNKK